MKVAVVGLWHLGCVTAACLTKFGHTVIAFDEDPQLIRNLKLGFPPLYEPGLTELITEGMKNNVLDFINTPEGLKDLDIIWITYDTFLNDLGQANINEITDRLRKLFPYFKNNALVIISSQIPVGTTQAIKNMFLQENKEKQIDFIYSPENLRLGKSIDLFLQPDRIIMGIRSEQAELIIKKLLHPIVDKILWMSIESAEMTKHAINAFLATSIVFINELATLCEYYGADVHSIAQGLKTDIRIGPNAYLTPGGAFSEGTLGRDLNYLVQMNKSYLLNDNFFQTVLLSNQNHSDWIQKKIIENIEDLRGKTVAVLGLAYKPGTDALRYSIAVKISLWLSAQGAIVNAYDPAIQNLVPELEQFINLQQDIDSVLYKSDVIVVGTECPEFMNIKIEQLDTERRKPYVFDTSGFLSKQLEGKKTIKYFKIGCNNEIT
ncbi:MAG: nucleotide sugar dehydrogenase [Candidatus Aquirickettsiella sp.]